LLPPIGRRLLVFGAGLSAVTALAGGFAVSASAADPTPAPAVAAGVIDAVASATPTATILPSDTATATISPSPSSSPSASSTPSATPTATVSPSATCATTVDVDADDIYAGDYDTVFGTAPAGRHVDVYAYTRPSTEYRLVRSGPADDNGEFATDVRPNRNTRLYAVAEGCDKSPSVVINVHTALSITAKRVGTRTYVFAGKTFPARGQVVSLYRVANDGSEVLAARVRAAADGSYSIRRTFSGKGRFDFFTYTGGDLENGEGVSNDRSTLIY
jgi:hypothetical protein